jgi:hypothetical protein
MTRPHSGTLPQTPGLSRGRHRPGKPQVLEGVPPAENIWHTFNPVNYDLVHIRIEAPTIVVMHHDLSNDTMQDKQQPRHDRVHRSKWARWWWRTARPLEWAFKIILVPTLVTTTLLYGLLLYLLKDAELLEAQRNRKEPDSPVAEDPVPSVDSNVSFNTLPRAFPTDVDLIAASKDGTVIATVGLQSEFVLWRKETQSYIAVDTTDVLLGNSSGSRPSASSALTSIAVNDRGTYVAVGTAAGVIGIWYIGQNRIQALPHLSVENLPSVVQIRFASSSPHTTGMSTPRRASGGRNGIYPDGNIPAEYAGTVYATYDNGLAMKWTVSSFTVPTYIRPSRAASVIKSMLLHVQPDDRLLMGFALEDGTLELCDLDSPNGILPHDCVVSAGNPADLVAKVHVCSVDLEGAHRVIVGAATQAGVVSLWDAGTGEPMYIIEEPYGPISQLRLAPVPTKRCPSCRELPAESFLLAFSVGQVVLFHRVYLSLPTRKCSCPINQPKLISRVQGRKNRSGSVASSLGLSSGTSSPVHPRSRIPSFSSSGTAFDQSTMFPVSAHGVHSRRTSEKRTLDPYIPLETDEVPDARCTPVGPQDVLVSSTTTSAFRTPGEQRSSLWENLIVVRAGEATVERGGWDVAGTQVVGIRRRPRVPLPGAGSSSRSAGAGTGRGVGKRAQVKGEMKGLSPSTLERWELWKFEPSISQLQASPLISLDEESRSSPPSLSTLSKHGPSRSTPPSPKFVPASLPKLDGMVGVKRRTLAKLQSPIPRLHFTRVSPFVCTRAFCIAGFGNTVGCFDLGTSSARQRPSLERMRPALGS